MRCRSKVLKYTRQGTSRDWISPLFESSKETAVRKSADFLTAVSLLDSKSGEIQSRLVPCRVYFRTFDRQRIESYLRREQPYDCAASAKAEGLSIALIARMETDDPTSLIGLPLIALTEMLERAGMPVLG